MSADNESRSVDKVVEDLLDAAAAGAEVIARGQEAWDSDRLLRLAGEAVISRIGDAADKLPDAVKEALPEISWDDIRANRILVAHVYHRIDYAVVWATLVQDVPRLASALRQWHELHRSRPQDRGGERDAGG